MNARHRLNLISSLLLVSLACSSGPKGNAQRPPSDASAADPALRQKAEAQPASPERSFTTESLTSGEALEPATPEAVTAPSEPAPLPPAPMVAPPSQPSAAAPKMRAKKAELGGVGRGYGTGGHSIGGPAVGSRGAALDIAGAPLQDQANTEAYEARTENGFRAVSTQPLSTFSVDVDTASYSNLRRMLKNSQAVPSGAVRIEELINYFSYDYPEPSDGHPFSVTTEVSAAPWSADHQLVHIGLQGKRFTQKAMPARNLVFLLDVSGSMAEPNKLPLLKRSLAAMVDTLTGKDHVSVVVYAGASGVVLTPTPANQKATILDALERLQAGGSTNGASGIELAYRVAEQHRRSSGTSRVILATDGDFNVGVSSQSELVRLIEQKRKSGIGLTVLGFGMGNYKDSTLEALADKGDGNYAYIDTFEEARKVLIQEAGSTLVTIAKDVKIQVEFNPALVGAYRLIGYENRVLANEDFNDDAKDAGEIGAGHSVTALYEIVPLSKTAEVLSVDPLKYQRPAATGSRSELLTVKLRYKQPKSEQSLLLERPLPSDGATTRPSADFRFSAAVASFGMLLTGSEHRGSSSYERVLELASGALGADLHGHRAEFLTLVRTAARQTR